MTNDRVYRNAIGHTRARTELRRNAGTQFDEEVVDAFLCALAERPVAIFEIGTDDAVTQVPAARGSLRWS
jgi:HD-GYP domain-containing protein (c-di-GMP phosphodiesterase class II)